MFPQGVRCFAYSHSLEVVATGSLDHTVRLWTPFSPQQPVACLFNHTTGVVGVAISEQSQHLFSLARDLVSYEICVWISKRLLYSHCVCGTYESTPCSRVSRSSSLSLRDSLTLPPPPSSSSPSPPLPSPSPAMNTWLGSLLAKVCLECLM